MIGDQSDIVSRLQALIPKGWFSFGQVPIRDAVLTGFANAFAFIYSLLAYIKLQTRISTSTDGWLDLTAFDFFGDSFGRSPGQSDASFRYQILATLFRKKNTVAAIKASVYQLLGTVPTVLEPNLAADVLCYDVPQSGGYDIAGIWADSFRMPLQVFVQIDVPGTISVAPPLVGGYGTGALGYGVGYSEYISGQSSSLPSVSNADIYQAINAVLPVTGVAWCEITVVANAGITTDTTSFTTDSTLISTDGGATV